MVVTKKNVALIGATGNLGPFIARALLDKKDQINVIIMTRNEQDSSKKGLLDEFKSKGATVKQFDSENVEQMAGALQKVDVVISSVGIPVIATQYKLIEACKKAGVKRFIPSEFGFPNEMKQLEGLGFFEERKKINKTARDAGLETTLIATGAFIEFFFSPFHNWDLKEGKGVIYDKPSRKIAMTTCADVGKVVADVALKDKFENKEIKIAGDVKSMEDMIKILEKVSGKKVTPMTVTEGELKKGLDADKSNPFAQIKWALSAGACDFDPSSNKDFPEIKFVSFEQRLKELNGN